MNYVVGIDGGGTKTQLTICDEEGNILYSVKSGPSNILSSGYEVAKASIREVIKQGIVDSGYGMEHCNVMCIGVAGAAREAVKKQLEEIIRDTGYRGKLLITHDAETALIGGTKGEEGILMIAGTGAICFGRTKEGRSHRVSGWGHIIGDEGSAYSIGIKIINAVMRAHDGRGKKTALTAILLKHMGIDTPEQIISYVYNPEVAKQHIAELAILIDDACKMKDEVAGDIIKEIIDDLYSCVDACIHKLEFNRKPVKVIVNGSVLVNNIYVNKGFREKLYHNYPLIEVCTMVHDAAYGAALLAIQNS